MERYWQAFVDSFLGYGGYLARELTTPHWGNYAYWLLGISLAVYSLELARPWRRDQPRIRRDFWLDAFYMAFNFFLFPLLGYAAVASVAELACRDLLAAAGFADPVAFDVSAWPVALQLATMLVARDFVHWNVHRILHRVPWLWEFHKVHHSVEQMGFAAHLRFHWMETVVYRTLEYVPLAMLGFGVDDFLWVHLFALTIGHLNHANFAVPYGPLRFVLNSPQMHIWHHAAELPPERRYGVNFGLTLSVWDWLFGTAWIPRSGRDVSLGFPGLERFPPTLAAQLVHPLGQAHRPAVSGPPAASS